MIKIKRSAIEDIAFLYAELKKFSQFYGTKIPLFPAKEDDALKVISNIVNSHVSFTSWVDDIRTGFIAGWFTRHPFNPEIMLLSEAFWWVREEFRETKSGSALLKAYVDWGQKNADWMTMTLEVDSPVPAAVLTKRGFKLKEQSYLMECK